MTSIRQALITPRCIVIAGPNDAGKTTFAREFLPKDTDVVHFVNADLIAGGLSALKPEIVAMSAGRVFLADIWSVYDNSGETPQMLETKP